jgi:tRNA modification GTPase
LIDVFSTQDTIVAIATPPGRGGIGIVRLSGPDAHTFARQLIGRRAPLTPRHATLATVTASESGDDAPQADDVRGGSPIDQTIVTYFPAPRSYTGEDVVELSAHGSPIVLQHIVAAAISRGARLAEPGEFTLRAFLNARIDLTQAEAVADLIDAVTPLQARAAFDQLQGTLTRTIGEIDTALFDLIARLEASVDFPEEGYHFVDPQSLAGEIETLIDRTSRLLADGRRGRIVREGFQIAIVGRPNVGKSTLFNALLGSARAIVSDMPGTTRDLIAETVDLEGLRATIVDTAGLRHTVDAIESEGVRRTVGATDVSDLILIVCDGSRPLSKEDREVFSQFIGNKALIVANKQDAGEEWSLDGVVRISAVNGSGLETLRARILESLDAESGCDRPSITNIRHVALLQRAHESMIRARSAAFADGGLPEEFVLADLQDARAAFEEVTGRRTPDDLLTHIFTRFCVGK